MESQNEIAQLQQRIKQFCEERDWDQYHNPKELAIGIITEASELLELFRFQSEQEIESMFMRPDKKTAICEEIADVFYFVLRLAQKYNIDLSAELGKKLAKNEQKYPVAKAKGSNKKYTELV